VLPFDVTLLFQRDRESKLFASSFSQDCEETKRERQILIVWIATEALAQMILTFERARDVVEGVIIKLLQRLFLSHSNKDNDHNPQLRQRVIGNEIRVELCLSNLPFSTSSFLSFSSISSMPFSHTIVSLLTLKTSGKGPSRQTTQGLSIGIRPLRVVSGDSTRSRERSSECLVCAKPCLILPFSILFLSFDAVSSSIWWFESGIADCKSRLMRPKSVRKGFACISCGVSILFHAHFQRMKCTICDREMEEDISRHAFVDEKKIWISNSLGDPLPRTLLVTLSGLLFASFHFKHERQCAAEMMTEDGKTQQEINVLYL